jgi:IS30 family transposase
MSYPHLSEHERFCLGHQRRAGWSLSRIAISLNRPKGTLSRELKRNRGEGLDHYDGYQAAQIERERRGQSRGAMKMSHEPLVKYVKENIGQEWSPEQISRRVQLDFPGDRSMRISHQCIYEWIDQDRTTGGIYYKHLRQANRKCRKWIEPENRANQGPGGNRAASAGGR